MEIPGHFSAEIDREGVDVVPKKKTLARTPWSKEDLRELKAHSKARTPVVRVAKAMKRTEARSDKRRRQSALVLVIAVEPQSL
jgi:NADH:ubiquinone oxidoreductase subunit